MKQFEQLAAKFSEGVPSGRVRIAYHFPTTFALAGGVCTPAIDNLFKLFCAFS